MNSPAHQTDEEKTRIFIEWKKKYAEAVVDHFHPKGDVLEIGFESRFAADRIYSFHPHSYTIIVFNLNQQESATEWAKDKSNVTLIKKDWRTALPELGKFDVIFFSDFPPEKDIEILKTLFPADFAKLTTEATSVSFQLKKQFSEAKGQFTDKDIEDFYTTTGQYNKEKLFRFFQTLKSNGNITDAQYDEVIHKYHLESFCEIANKPTSDLIACLQECVVGHLNKGGWFTIFLRNQTTQFDDPLFFEKVISNINMDYKEEIIPVPLEDGPRQGLIISVEACN